MQIVIQFTMANIKLKLKTKNSINVDKLSEDSVYTTSTSWLQIRPLSGRGSKNARASASVGCRVDSPLIYDHFMTKSTEL